jgi:hypothetical protein
MCERIARTGPLMLTMNAPSYGLDGTTSSNVSSVRLQPALVTCTLDRSRMFCPVEPPRVIVMPSLSQRSPKCCV